MLALGGAVLPGGGVGDALHRLVGRAVGVGRLGGGPTGGPLQPIGRGQAAPGVGVVAGGPYDPRPEQGVGDGDGLDVEVGCAVEGAGGRHVRGVDGDIGGADGDGGGGDVHHASGRGQDRGGRGRLFLARADLPRVDDVGQRAGEVDPSEGALHGPDRGVVGAPGGQRRVAPGGERGLAALIELGGHAVLLPLHRPLDHGQAARPVGGLTQGELGVGGLGGELAVTGVDHHRGVGRRVQPHEHVAGHQRHGDRPLRQVGHRELGVTQGLELEHGLGRHQRGAGDVDRHGVARGDDLGLTGRQRPVVDHHRVAVGRDRQSGVGDRDRLLVAQRLGAGGPGRAVPATGAGGQAQQADQHHARHTSCSPAPHQPQHPSPGTGLHARKPLVRP